ncbi:Response to dessication 2 [Heracleum sosnowskyi]|uniref:Response to dessication 2 n=1 Tax=Heracleum sosnowskyi TaxID=360622 RepID=A0AAD8GPD3_9APIA|nr:Response to dessication 2 [Heracleum sosnowskyi]
MTMETLMEDVEYNWADVDLTPIRQPELPRETGERRRGRDIVIAIDHGPSCKFAFDWAIVHLCRLADTIHLIHAVSSLRNEVVCSAAEARMEKLAVEAMNVAMVETKARIVQGDAGKAICKEVERLKPAALVMGTRGRTLFQSIIQGSVSEYCYHNCKSTAVIIVPEQCIYE